MSGRIQGLVVVLFLTTIGAVVPASAQTRLFSDDSELQVVIEAPLNTLVRTAARNTDPHRRRVHRHRRAARRSASTSSSSAGGVSRRTGGICTFPPLRLNFDGDAVRGTLMQGQNRLKLVTRCRNGANYEQLTVLEYTAYRLYNEITPLSFRVRPARVTYRDTDGRRREDTQFNFLIEDVDDLARRNGRRVELEVAPDTVRSSQLDAEVVGPLRPVPVHDRQSRLGHGQRPRRRGMLPQQQADRRQRRSAHRCRAGALRLRLFRFRQRARTPSRPKASTSPTCARATIAACAATTTSCQPPPRTSARGARRSWR